MVLRRPRLAACRRDRTPAPISPALSEFVLSLLHYESFYLCVVVRAYRDHAGAVVAEPQRRCPLHSAFVSLILRNESRTQNHREYTQNRRGHSLRFWVWESNTRSHFSGQEEGVLSLAAKSYPETRHDPLWLNLRKNASQKFEAVPRRLYLRLMDVCIT